MFEDLTKRPSAMVLIIANLLPLVGVVLWGWSIFNIVLLYWMENLVLGGINILKMITCRPDPGGIDVSNLVPGGLGARREEILRQFEDQGGMDMALKGHSAMKLFMVPFFTVHYFGFCAGHGFFVFHLFGDDGGMGHGLFASFERVPDLLTGGFLLAAIGLVASHLYSFVANYLGRGEYRRTIVPVLMFKLYGRIFVLHVAIIFGGFVVMSLGSPIGLLLILIVGKIGIDLAMHLREHRKADEGI